MSPRTSFPRRIGRHTLVGCTALTLSLGASAQGQEGFIPLEPVEGPPPRVWYEPRLMLGMGVRSKGTRSNPRTRIEERIEISPGISGVLNTPRVQGSFDYELSSLIYPQNEDKGRIGHQLAAQGTVNAWANHAFVDLSASVRQRAISLFDDPGDRRASESTAESTQLMLSPSLRGGLGRLANYELRYSAYGQNMGSDDLPGMTAQTASAQLASRRGGAPLGWMLMAQSQEMNYEFGRDTRSDSARAGLVLRPLDTLELTALAGRESNDILTLERKTYDTRGVNVDWRPSQRTRLFVGVEDRYFGRGHNVSLSHSTARTVWRYTDTRGVSNSGVEASAAPLGTLRDLIDSWLLLRYPDPVERTRLVNEELARLNYPGDIQVFQTFLSSSAVLQRAQRLSLALMGVRSTFTLAYVRNDNRRLSAPLGQAAPLNDDFESNQRIRQKGWNALVSHRLTPQMSANLGYTDRNTVGDVDRRHTRALDLGVVTRVGWRTDASVSLSRARHSGNFRSYNDSGIYAQVVHRF